MAKFSIRYKFLFVTTLLLFLCVGAYLYIAIDTFRADKKELVFDYNRDLVKNISSDIDSFFRGVGDKMKLTAVFFRQKQSGNQRLLEELLKKNSDIVFLGVSDGFKTLDRQVFYDGVFAETYSINESFFNGEMVEARPVPYQRIQVNGEALWNASVKDGPPLIGYGKSVVEEDERGIPMNQFAVVAYVNATKISKALSGSQLNSLFVTNNLGETLVQSQQRTKVTDRNSGLVSLALNSKVRTQVKSFTEGHEKMMGAFSKAFKDQVFVMSQVSEKKAFQAVDRLVYQSVLFALIVLTVAFIVAIFFSRSLTHPIEVLVGGMHKVSGGDLSTRIQVKSRDEIATLAQSFNNMIAELRQSRLELEEINRELESKVLARTRQLEEQNQAVKQAQEALLRSTRLAAVGEVAGQAAHEVLNPLTSIMSRLKKVKKRLDHFGQDEAGLLKEIREAWGKDYTEGGFSQLEKSWQKPSTIKQGASLWDEDMQNLATIEGNLQKEFNDLVSDAEFLLGESERINRIVNSMRSMSRVTGDIKNHSGNELVEKSIKIMADLASQNQVSIDTELKAEPDIIQLDEDEFIQVMTNLIRNSLQSIEMNKNRSAPGRIHITTKIESNHFEVHIKDNGVGIEEKNRKRLFEKHFTTKRREGTGIGLSISRRLIRAFKGDIHLKETRLGEGSTFVVALPLISESGRASA